METLSFEKIHSYLTGNLISNNNKNDILEIVIDSREATDKSLFIPIIGENHDGHKFLESAYENGCRSFLIDKNHKFDKNDINLIEVKDTKLAYGEIAKNYKRELNIPCIAITGSVGKTSTKDMIYGVLSEKYNTSKTIGNLNNDIGVPKTILKLNKSHEISIIEMGMDKKGEISYLTNLVKPNIGVITNIGMSHIEHFENQEGIFNAKMELTEPFNENNILIVNGDDKFLKQLKNKNKKYKIITCGFEKENDIYCEDYEVTSNGATFTCIYNGEKHKYTIPSPAKHNILNAMFAIAIGNIYNLTENQITKGLQNFKLSSNRLDIFKTKDYTIINDTYNASYDSMMSALEVLNNFNTRKVAILGDIFELGSYSEEIHRKIGKNIKCDLLITIGNNSKYIYEEAKEKIESYHHSTKEEFYQNMNILEKEDTILVKASRGMELEQVVEKLK